MMRRRLLAAVPLASLVALLYACGGSDASPGFDEGKHQSACEAANQVLCKRACSCAGGVGCSFDDPGVGATTTFGSLEQCQQTMVSQQCSDGGNPAIDYAECEALLDSAQCVEDSGKKAVSRPRACVVPVDAPGGGDASSG